ncbi:MULTISPECIES: hypothetical protein [Paenibacillus]|uniref:hypothetical protein n=1 Tax=Paenibacillus TaxID=44249 RepID=UPI0003E27939|nr:MULTISPECIES: hypothetical protein [Paenibacillus]ANA81073.1 hypothetical protein A3958_14310 [Paenibacillus glucanolyticus]ETT36358.1 hypothetical protein C169_14029 [Paenibacillus sp. FSL R5-808]
MIERAAKKGSWKLLPYQKLKNEYGTSFPDDLYHSLSKQDVYELPLGLNRRLITERWEAFAEQTLDEAGVMIFECCFIQNPVTVGMVKYDALEGVEGTLEVLEARRKLEHRILDSLGLNKERINNSLYDQETYRTMLMDKLKLHGVIQ